MASVQARHTRSCRNGRPWTTFEAALAGCTCQRGPLYHVVLRHDGKLVREPAGRNRKLAQRALDKVHVQVDEGEYQPRRDIRFRDWADEWKQSLKRPKENTKDSYTSTITYAKEAFGEKYVRQITAADIDRFLALMPCAGSTQAKHLRVLGACLRKAVRRGYAPRNPIESMDAAEKPQATTRESAYFEDGELVRLFGEIPEGLYRILFTAALKTGLRQGELLALEWGDVDLTAGTLTVRRNYTAGKLSTTKSGRVRHLELTDDVVQLLGAWWGECGHPGDDVLVFPGADGHLNAFALGRGVLYPAMKRAGVDRVGPTGEKRTFHSFRHTYARIALESGTEIFWLQRQMGHSSYKVTTDRYGHWERKASKREAAKVRFPALGVRTDARTDPSQTTPTNGNGLGTHKDREAAVLHAITTQPETPLQTRQDF